MFVLKERGGEGGKEEDKEEEDEREKKYLKVQKEKDNFKLYLNQNVSSFQALQELPKVPNLNEAILSTEEEYKMQQ